MSNTLGKSPPPAVKRRRGAPLSNANAFKHGFYSTRLHPAEKETLQSHLASDLDTELSMVNEAILNLLNSASGDSLLSWKQALDQLRAVTLAVGAKANLLRLQSNLQGKLADLEEMESRVSQSHTAPAEATPGHPASTDDLLPTPGTLTGE